ncbi:hypothetical protein PHMEG_00034278 [Phytophthora megakarya]|uniref:Uncharacterized protein n=1 Tax=Phytophthora megakarya TaxID=4795 RepID=A0A225UTZ0_9STRA|nr:hypothetical protein PHMEG_00034278 [Phytophthora megakarya]
MVKRKFEQRTLAEKLLSQHYEAGDDYTGTILLILSHRIANGLAEPPSSGPNHKMKPYEGSIIDYF